MSKTFFVQWFQDMYGKNKKMSDETARNSAVVDTIRPETLRDELGIKKTAYYKDLEFLDIKTEKDESGNVFLNIEQANQVRSLRSYMKNNGGKRTGFLDSNPNPEETGGELATTEDGGIAASAAAVSNFHPPEQSDPYAGIDQEALYREASEIAAFNMTVGQQVVLAMANQLSYDDLHPDAKAKVDSVNRAANPKAAPQAIAAKLLDQIRSQRSENPQTEAVEAA